MKSTIFSLILALLVNVIYFAFQIYAMQHTFGWTTFILMTIGLLASWILIPVVLFQPHKRTPRNDYQPHSQIDI